MFSDAAELSECAFLEEIILFRVQVGVIKCEWIFQRQQNYTSPWGKRNLKSYYSHQMTRDIML